MADHLAWAPVYAMANILLCVMFLAPAFGICCVIGALVPPRTFQGYFRRMLRLAIFAGAFALTNAFFSFVWENTIWGRLYLSSDYCGNDFLAFIPIGHRALDATFGNEPHGLLGNTTLPELQWIWLSFAIGTWVVTFFAYRQLVRKFLRSEACGRSSVVHPQVATS